MIPHLESDQTLTTRVFLDISSSREDSPGCGKEHLALRIDIDVTTTCR